MNYGLLCLADKVEEMTHAQKTSPVDMKIATIKPRPSSRCLVTPTDMNVSTVLKELIALFVCLHVNFKCVFLAVLCATSSAEVPNGKM